MNLSLLLSRPEGAAGMGDTAWTLYITLSVACLIIIFLAALVTIFLVLFQKSNSDGIQGITASSETFFGKNRGQSIESKLKNGLGSAWAFWASCRSRFTLFAYLFPEKCSLKAA